MKVTALLTLLVLGLLLAPLPSDAQQPGKVPRIGVVVPAERASPEEPNIAAFRQALRDLGYVEGQTIAVRIPPTRTASLSVCASSPPRWSGSHSGRHRGWLWARGAGRQARDADASYRDGGRR